MLGAQTSPPIALGNHHTIYYQCVATKEEYFSSVEEVSQWISNGPILQPPCAHSPANTHVTAPPYNRPHEDNHAPATNDPGPPAPAPNMLNRLGPTPEAAPIMASRSPTEKTPPIMPDPALDTRRKSTRTPIPRNRLQPTHHGKVYQVGKAKNILKKQRVFTHLPGKQRVPITWEYPEKQRVSVSELKINRNFFC